MKWGHLSGTVPRNPIAACCVGVLLFLIILGQPAQAGRRALLVGVERYPNQKVNLPGVRQDVNLVVTALTKQGVFSEQEIKTLLDGEATKRKIVTSFKEWLIDGTGPGDTVLFYYSGHGDQVWDESGDEIQDGMDEVLLCWDFKIFGQKERRIFRGAVGYAYPLNQTMNLLLDDEIRDLLKELKGRRVIFLSDSCHSGSVYKRLDPFFVQNKMIDQPTPYKSVFDERLSELIGEVPLPKRNNIGDDILVPGVDLVAITASEDSQIAQMRWFRTHPRGRHSVFTWYLYHGLMGKADLDRNGVVTFGELTSYVRRRIREDGFTQVPQHEFQPKSLASDSLVSSVRRVSPGVEMPSGIGCAVVAKGVPQSTVKALKSRLSASLPFIFWTNDRKKIACRIRLEKRGNLYGARLSDSTGSYWESQQGPSWESLVGGISGNLRAYYVQTALSGLRNPKSRLHLDLKCKLRRSQSRAPIRRRITAQRRRGTRRSEEASAPVYLCDGCHKGFSSLKCERRNVEFRFSESCQQCHLKFYNLTCKRRGSRPRAPGEAVEGDVVIFEAKAPTPGYLYIFNVDTMGVIHPLHPGRKSRPSRLTSRKPVVLGADGSVICKEPLGREMVFGFLFASAPASLGAFWAKDHIGLAQSTSIAEQQRFLEALWGELMPGGKPKGDWTSRLLILKSFKK